MKRYTKRTKPLSRKALERKLRKAEKTIKCQSAMIQDDTERIFELQDRTHGAESRVKELGTRLDGIFGNTEHFRVEAHLSDMHATMSAPMRVNMDLQRLCLEIAVRDLFLRPLDASHTKAHIVDMMLRKAKTKLIEALRVI
jgi:hypothetical protein